MYFESHFVVLENQSSLKVDGETLSPSAILLDFQLRHTFPDQKVIIT